MAASRDRVAIEPRGFPRDRRYGAGLVAAGGATVVGSSTALAFQSYRIHSHALGPLGGVGLSFTGTAPYALLAFWIVLGLLPLLAVVYPRVGVLALGVSLLLGVLVQLYVLANSVLLPLMQSSPSILALCEIAFAGACLNCVGSQLLRRAQRRTSRPDRIRGSLPGDST